MEITSIKIYPVETKKKSSLLAFASVTFDDCFAVTGIRVVQGKDSVFCAMPSRYSENDDEYYDVCFPVTKNFRTELFTAIIEAYEEETGEDDEDEKPKKSGKHKK